MLVEEGTDPAIRHRKNLAGLDELEIFGKIANEELNIDIRSSSYLMIFHIKDVSLTLKFLEVYQISTKCIR